MIASSFTTLLKYFAPLLICALVVTNSILRNRDNHHAAV